MTHLAVARLWFCSNSFTPLRTRASDVHRAVWTQAEGPAADALSRRGVGDELEGVRRFIASRHDWTVTVLRSDSAPTGGPLSADVFGSWMADVEDGLRRGRFDAVYLSLHGACQAEGDPSADLTILRRVRAIMGHTPVVASFDMRANLSEETAILLDGASASRVWPDGGGDDAAIRALGMLEAILAGRSRPVGALARVPMILPDAFLREALSELWREELPTVPEGVLDASVHFGFAWGDSPYAGPSALVWADRDAGLARETAARLAINLVRWRSRSLPALTTPERALQHLLDSRVAGCPALLLDSGDDPAVGGLADTPTILRALIAAEATLPGQVALIALHDSETVAAAAAAGVGGTLQRALGGRTTPLYGAPVPLTLLIVALANTESAGRIALLRNGQVDILITEQRPRRVSPALLAEAGMATALYVLLVLKAGEIARVEFAETGGPTHVCDCPGPTSADLSRLPFHYVPPARRVSFTQPPPEPSFMARPRAAAGSISTLPIEQGGAEQAQQRHEERRANAQQKRADPLGTQRRHVGIQP